MDEIGKLRLRKKIWNVLGWAAVVFAILSMIGMLVSVLLLGLEIGSAVLTGSLFGGFAGGVFLFGGLGFLALRRGEKAERAERDALERADGEASFFLGEGVLGTFGKNGLRIHGDAGKREIDVPYAEMRFFSVCSRRAPKEKGTWCVVMEIPARHLSKKSGKNDPPVLVQTDAKERLFRVLKEHDLALSGELPPKDAKKKAEPFCLVKKYALPDAARRTRAIVSAVLGFLLACAGAGAVFWNVTVGAVLLVFGLFWAVRSFSAFVRAKAVLAFYVEGVYYREPSGADNVFLKWEEITRFSVAEADGKHLRAECLYGAYDFPFFPDAIGFLREKFPDKCREN